MTNKFFGPNEEQDFWTWFNKNKDDYYHFENNQERLFDELNDRLKRINENLVFEFSPIHEDGIREMFISADGIKSAFDSVISLVGKAPQIPGWKVIAFRQRIPGDDISIDIGGIKIGYSDIYFRYGEDDGKIGIELNIRAFDSNDNRIKSALYILLDGLIGEYDMETKIGWIDWVDLDGAKIDSLIPLVELRDIVDGLKGQ